MLRVCILVAAVFAALLLAWGATCGVNHLASGPERLEQDEQLWRMSQRGLAECEQKYGVDAPDEVLDIGMRTWRKVARQDMTDLLAEHPEWRGKAR
jgi:hypothetical protein